MRTALHLAIGVMSVVSLLVSSHVYAALKPSPQNDYEHEVSAVVRNKLYYKGGRIEISALGGTMPYDSSVAHFSLGMRATWHISDHLAWEIIDAQLMFPSLTSYATNLASANGLPSIQLLKINQSFTSNIIFSPIYGKIRFFGSSVLHFDLYMALGFGGINREIVNVSAPSTGAPAVVASVGNAFDPVVDFGIGAKFFVNNSIGIVLDLRDYLAFTPLYGRRAPKSNFSVFAGVSFFL
jgi:outer membrane beta-barrel protein